MTANPDIYHSDKKYAAALLRLKNDPSILKVNKTTIKKFLDSREANGLSLSRIVKHANHLIVAGRLCNKRFQKMTKFDVIQLLLDLKHKKETKARAATIKLVPCNHVAIQSQGNEARKIRS